MKALWIAVGLVIVGSIFCYLVVHASLANGDFAGSVYETQVPLALAGVLLGTAPYLYQVFRKVRRPNYQILPTTITPFEEYTLPWPVMLILGTLVTLAFSNLGALLVWILGEITNVFFTQTIPYFNLVFTALAFLWVSTWVGSRSDRMPFLVVVGILILFAAVNRLTQFAAVDRVNLLIRVLEPIAIIIFAFIGVWRGRKRRFSYYLQYLLRLLSPSDRQLLIQNGYEAAKRLTSSSIENKTPVMPKKEKLPFEPSLQGDQEISSSQKP